MKVHYKRDLNSNYMILTDDQPTKETYEVRMITENRIYGFLPCVRQIHDLAAEYYYEITGRQSMELLYERRNLNCTRLKGLLQELLKILESASEYLLDPNKLILSPGSIYMHTKSEKPCLCYYPGYEKKIQESFLELAEYLLGKLDKSDTEGVAFGYELYQSALEPNFSLLDILHRHADAGAKLPQKPSAPLVPPSLPVSVQEETLKRTGSWKNFFRKKPAKARLEDYVAEDGQAGTGSALYIKEEEPLETVFLQEEKNQGLFLRCLDAEYPDIQAVVNDGNFLVGKMKESVDGCIPAPTVSRIHARIFSDGSGWFIEDLNSTNGTWVDGIQLDPYELFPLQNGMHILFASVEYEARL